MPGLYRDETGQLRYWRGYGWDPREVASIWTRVWCYVVDILAVFLIVFLVSFGIGFMMGIIDPTRQTVPRGLGLFLTVVVFMLYFSISYAGAGRTPGMALGRLEVLSLPKGGTRPSIGTAALRSLILGIGMAIPFGGIIWLGLAAGSLTRQGPHDKAAHTVVLRRRRVQTEPTRTAPPLAAQAPPGDGLHPGTPPVLYPSAAPVVGGRGEFAPQANRSRRKWIIALVSVGVAVVAVVSAILIDSRIKQSETLELLAAVEQAESNLLQWSSDPRWDEIVAIQRKSSAACRNRGTQSCFDNAWADFVNGVNSIALDYIPQVQRDMLDVEGVTTLPWHGDVRTAQDAYLDNANVGLDLLKWHANLSPTTKTPDWDQFNSDLSTTYEIAKRRFIEIKFVPAGPQDVQDAIDRVFAT